MNIDEEKINEAAIALLYLTLHDNFRAWKQIDFDVMDRLYEKGYIHNPRGKTKSVAFTDVGLEESEKQFNKLFRK